MLRRLDPYCTYAEQDVITASWELDDVDRDLSVRGLHSFGRYTIIK